MSVAAIVGGQFGSEGKGLIAGLIAREYGHHVRVGAANAGHTLYTFCEHNGHDQDDLFQKHVMQQLPCAAYANPDAALYIGPGAQISADIFETEIRQLVNWRKQHHMSWSPEIFVDYRAHVITQEHINREQESGLAERIGSTSTIAREGIGAAQAARVMRDESCLLAGDHFVRDRWPITLVDVPAILSKRRRAETQNRHLLLEGTQGTGLSLTTGPFPYVTSRNTTAAGLCADAGVPPNHLDRVILVCRSYPIRVAGNSGPFHSGSREIQWPDIKVDPEKERTTVTKKIRRVATFSLEQVVEAATLNGATEIALTFADYLDPKIAFAAGRWDNDSDLRLFKKVYDRVFEIEQATDLPVTFIGTGPHSVIRRYGS